MSDGITYLTSIPTLPKHLRAERVAPDPSDRRVIDRNSTIIVEKELMNTEKIGQMAPNGDVITAPPPEARPEVTYATRPQASDPLMVRPDIQIGEHGVGAPPMVRTAAEINANQPIRGATEVRGTTEVKMQTAGAKPVIPTKVVQAVQPQQPLFELPPVVSVKPKVRVKLSNNGMGKVTVSVQSVAVGENCVVLAYPKEAENIVEPPLCASDNPIRVDYGDKRYDCTYAGQAVELDPYFLVILIRIPEDE